MGAAPGRISEIRIASFPVGPDVARGTACAEATLDVAVEAAADVDGTIAPPWQAARNAVHATTVRAETLLLGKVTATIPCLDNESGMVSFPPSRVRSLRAPAGPPPF
jgi:hypothetical protein